MVKNFIPTKWKDKIIKINAKNDGMSPAEVVKIKTQDGIFYLKSTQENFSNTTYSVRREKEVVEWLNGKLPIPQIIDAGIESGREFLIMSELKGKRMDKFIRKPEVYVTHLVNAIKQLQAVDITNCPFNSSIDIRLAELKYLLDNGLASIDTGDWEKSTTFINPAELYKWLCENRPAEEFVFSHGDVVANLFTNDSGYYFYDLGRGGMADKWLDIAFCVRDIRYLKNSKKHEDMFFELLNIKPNYPQIEYFILLDEMF